MWVPVWEEMGYLEETRKERRVWKVLEDLPCYYPIPKKGGERGALFYFMKENNFESGLYLRYQYCINGNFPKSGHYIMVI